MSEPRISGEVFRAMRGEYSVQRQTPRAKAPGGVDLVDRVHRNEDTGKPCTYCLIPATDGERAYYHCPGVRKVERDRRLAARDYQGSASTTTRAVESVTVEARMVEQTVEQVHTAVYDRDRERLEALKPLTANEERLALQGGADAVIEDRRHHARVAGNPDWKTIGEPRPEPTPKPSTVTVDVQASPGEAEQTAGRRFYRSMSGAPRPFIPEAPRRALDVPVTDREIADAARMAALAESDVPVKRGRGPDKGPRKRRRKPKKAPTRGADGRYTSMVNGTE